MRTPKYAAGLISVLALTCCLPVESSWAEEQYILDAAAAAGKKEFAATVPTNGLVQLGIIKMVPTNLTTQVALHLGQFRSEREGKELTVQLSETNLIFGSNQVLYGAILRVEPTTSTDRYSGTLVLSASGLAPILWRITLSSADPHLNRSGTLVVDQNTLNCSLKHSWFEWLRPARDPQPEASFTIHDKTNTLPLRGVRISYSSITSPEQSNFDIEKNVTFFWNGSKISALAQWPPSDSSDLQRRTIDAGGQVRIGLGFQGLTPGQYAMELKPQALGAQDDDRQQKVTVNMKVADPIWPAILVLLVALFISFFSYKWLSLYRQRLDLQKRITELRPDWLSDEPPLYTVVWVRTVLRQAEELTRQMLLVSPGFITERIDRVLPVLDALNQARRARTALENLPRMVKNRFGAVISDQVRSIRDEGMSKLAAEKAGAELATLATELSTRTYLKRYWAEVDRAVGDLLGSFNPQNFEANCIQEGVVAKNMLLSQLRPDNKPPAQPLEDELDIIKYETAYAKLKLLIERRHCPEFEKLVGKVSNSLEDSFAVADDAAWEKITKSNPTITPLLGDGSKGIEAYQPITFAVSTGDPELDNTYLFNRGLRFEWTFQLATNPKYQTVTLSPRVAEFALGSGQFSVSARILRETVSGTKTVAAKDTSLTIAKSSDLSWLQNVERTEVWSLSLAGLFALISGLLTFYYKNPIFGSAQDYLALFLWGVGIEQGKNLLQTLQSASQNAKS